MPEQRCFRQPACTQLLGTTDLGMICPHMICPHDMSTVHCCARKHAHVWCRRSCAHGYPCWLGGLRSWRSTARRTGCSRTATRRTRATRWARPTCRPSPATWTWRPSSRSPSEAHPPGIQGSCTAPPINRVDLRLRKSDKRFMSVPGVPSPRLWPYCQGLCMLAFSLCAGA